MARAHLRITFDSLQPGLRRLRAQGRSPKPILEAGALAMKSRTREAFVNPGIRPATWRPKKDGSPSNLTKSTNLQNSIDVTRVTNRQAEVTSDRRYAARHQLGSLDGSTPARPFFPYILGRITREAEREILDVMRLKMELLLKRATR